MIPNYFVIFWNDRPVGLDNHSGGYPFKTEFPFQINYWASKEAAQKYIDTMQRADSEGHYSDMHIKEIQFRIVNG